MQVGVGAVRWQAKAIDAEAELSKASKGPDGDLSGSLADAFLRQGPVTAACEIDQTGGPHRLPARVDRQVR
ncbi:hypothetical protein ACFYZB_29095 [Streptomyces sp. NPDC001852]|uniref:hypothetical protein n=1 Tax=Streptomyces sp. NPDC001852 TaxID=3364619 RepID=UPI00368B15E5